MNSTTQRVYTGIIVAINFLSSSLSGLYTFLMTPVRVCLKNPSIFVNIFVNQTMSVISQFHNQFLKPLKTIPFCRPVQLNGHNFKIDELKRFHLNTLKTASSEVVLPLRINTLDKA